MKFRNLAQVIRLETMLRFRLMAQIKKRHINTWCLEFPPFDQSTRGVYIEFEFNGSSCEQALPISTLPANTLGITEVGSSSNGEIDRYSADVYLNVNVLPSASQELIVVTIIHEVLHGYLDYTRSSELFNDHEEMANDCVQRMAIALKNLFPNLSNSDAEALAWGGLEETKAWKTMLVDEPVKANAILKLNQNHARGRAGTRC